MSQHAIWERKQIQHTAIQEKNKLVNLVCDQQRFQRLAKKSRNGLVVGAVLLVLPFIIIFAVACPSATAVNVHWSVPREHQPRGLAAVNARKICLQEGVLIMTVENNTTEKWGWGGVFDRRNNQPLYYSSSVRFQTDERMARGST